MDNEASRSKKKNVVPDCQSRDNIRQEQRSCQHAETEESLNRRCARNQVERFKSKLERAMRCITLVQATTEMA